MDQLPNLYGSNEQQEKRQATPKLLSDQKKALKKIVQYSGSKRRYVSPQTAFAQRKCYTSRGMIHFSRVREIKLKQLKSAGMDNILEGLRTELQKEDIRQ